MSQLLDALLNRTPLPAWAPPPAPALHPNSDSHGRPTPAEVREELAYDPLTGVLTWKTDRKIGAYGGTTPRVGLPAGSLSRLGYINVGVLCGSFGAHRLAWVCHYGEWPSQNIDHINGVRSDNRIENLRDVSQAANTHNMRNAPRHNTSGLMGACLHKQTGKYRAFIKVKRKQIALGLYDTLEQAHAAYVAAKSALHADGFTAVLSSNKAAHFPLPRGEYPTAKWPEGCTHLPQGGAK